jgi:protease-4
VDLHLPGRDRLLLELDLSRPLADPPPSPGWQRISQRSTPQLRTTLTALRRAIDDRCVVGLIVRTGGPPQPLATVQELRAGLLRFRAAGKPVWAWAESYGEYGRGTVSYLLAAAADQVWLQPSGELALTGVAAEVTFLREGLDRLGVTAQVSARHEYKSAPNMFTERGFTQAHRAATTALVDSVANQVIDTLAADRGLSAETLRDCIDRAPLCAQDALAAGLLDRVGYRDEAYAAMREELGEVELRSLAHYAAHPAPREAVHRIVRRDRRRVGLVDVTGTIRLGSDGRGAGARGAGSDRVCAALRAAAAAEEVAAVVLRVDSPGGSYAASDSIWRATAELRRDKPLVVSMARVAASGGYYVAMSADRILALPGTLTGSIGVFGGKFVFADLLARVGIGHDSVAVGRAALRHSPRVPFDAGDLAALEAMLDRIYADFTEKVATARGLDAAAVDSVARGRVWTGADAVRCGLVDELGGLHEAAVVARQLAGLPVDAPVRGVPGLHPLAALRTPRSSEDPRAAQMSSWGTGWGAWGPLAAVAQLESGGPLTAPVTALIG